MSHKLPWEIYHFMLCLEFLFQYYIQKKNKNNLFPPHVICIINLFSTDVQQCTAMCIVVILYLLFIKYIILLYFLEYTFRTYHNNII